MKPKKEKSKGKASLIKALFSKDKSQIRSALGILKPIKFICFVHEADGKIYLEEGLTKKEVAFEEKEAIIREYEKECTLIVFNEEKSSNLDEPIKD